MRESNGIDWRWFKDQKPQQGGLTVKFLSFRCLVVTAFCLSAFSLPNASWGQTNVCVVDIAKVFKSHKGFTDQMALLTQEAQTLQARLQETRNQLVKLNEQLVGLKAGSEEYKKLENQIAHASANFEIERRNNTRALMVREAKLHFDTYVEITQYVANYAQAQNIRMVLRHNSEEVDRSKPDSIMRRVNSNIVLMDDHRDITDAIISRLRTAQANTGTNR